MDLKTATTIAIVGAAAWTVLGVMFLIAPHVPALAKILYAGRGTVINVLYAIISATFLLFFITLRGKQK